jgi:hypothetical protein
LPITNKDYEDVRKYAYATGGIASGPASGYTAMLHGTEAVVPLPDGRSIPVRMDKDDTAEEVRQLRADLREVGRVLANNTKDTARLLQRWDGGDAMLIREDTEA